MEKYISTAYVFNASGDRLVVTNVDSVIGNTSSKIIITINKNISYIDESATASYDSMSKFISGDLSKVTFVKNRYLYNLSNSEMRNKILEFDNYYLDPTIEEKKDHFLITLFKEDEPHKKALENRQTILDLYDAVASVYESKL